MNETHSKSPWGTGTREQKAQQQINHTLLVGSEVGRWLVACHHQIDQVCGLACGPTAQTESTPMHRFRLLDRRCQGEDRAHCTHRQFIRHSEYLVNNHGSSYFACHSKMGQQALRSSIQVHTTPRNESWLTSVALVARHSPVSDWYHSGTCVGILKRQRNFLLSNSCLPLLFHISCKSEASPLGSCINQSRSKLYSDRSIH
jgi:hypothetical protein